MPVYPGAFAKLRANGTRFLTASNNVGPRNCSSEPIRPHPAAYLASVTRKRSLVQSQYRPPVQRQIFEYLIDRPGNDSGGYRSPAQAGTGARHASRRLPGRSRRPGGFRVGMRGGLGGSGTGMEPFPRVQHVCAHEPQTGMGPGRISAISVPAARRTGRCTAEPMDFEVENPIRAQTRDLRRLARRVPHAGR
jgi:hypothetical protein